MKKTISRAFSLFLVLAILVGVMPAVLAAGELTVTGDSTVVVGGSSIELTAVHSTGVSLDGFTWSWTKTSGEGEVTLSGASTPTCTVSGTKAGSVTLTVTATKTEESEEPEEPAEPADDPVVPTYLDQFLLWE